MVYIFNELLISDMALYL